MKIVMIHGNGGGVGDDVWKPWLKAELEARGHMVLSPTFPDNYEAKASVWLPYLRDELNVDEDVVLIGHSSGAVAAMRYAEKYRVRGSFLIGACYTDLDDPDERISGYYDAPWQWEKIRSNQQFIVLLASSDDPWIPIYQPRHIAQSLQCEYHEYTDKGHFIPHESANENEWKKFPELLQIITNHIADELL
jgi:putative hydrolase RBBP9